MSGNTKSMPLVSILMAVYNPNYNWFKEQLISLNNQTYENLELVIYDDCPRNPVDEIFIKENINNFCYKIIRGERNQGSNKAFEKLTQIGKGDYFAYCDQDDIWETDKIEILMHNIKSENSVLAYSDMAVIDENSLYRHEILLKAKPRIEYIHGENLLDRFFFKNCVSGCCMLIERNVAQNAIPFSNTLIHDQWLCIAASLYGKISFVDRSLVRYRIHGNNQTGSLKGINNKEDYYRLRVVSLKDRLNDLKTLIQNRDIYLMHNKNCNNEKLKLIEEFCSARINKSIFKIFKYKDLCKSEAYFEIVIKYMPDVLVRLLLKRLKE